MAPQEIPAWRRNLITRILFPAQPALHAHAQRHRTRSQVDKGQILPSVQMVGHNLVGSQPPGDSELQVSASVVQLVDHYLSVPTVLS